MHARSVRHLKHGGVLATRCVPRPHPMAAAVAQSQRWNSFIKNVMDQVKKDMEKDPKMKQDWEKFQKKKSGLEDTSTRHKERLDEFGNRMKSASLKTSEILSKWRDRASEAKATVAAKASEATEKNESLKQAAEALKEKAEKGSAASSSAFQKGRNIFASVMDKSTDVFSKGEDETAVKHREFKQAQAARDAAAAAQKAREEAAEAAAASGAESDKDAKAEAKPEEQGDALVVSKQQEGSSWDRFGARLGDMPFLSNVFENPLFDRLFGESEIAASIREMKEIEPYFMLEDFAEEMEYVVAPHIIQNYLDGNQETLELHCGEAAFAAVNASIKARITNKMTLDTNILAGPKELELKGAQRMDKGPPCFIWTFNTQQVNCLRDRDGEIIEGAVDDIRTVYYAMAVHKHPELEKTLEYPWQVSELAIVGNQPCW